MRPPSFNRATSLRDQLPKRPGGGDQASLSQHGRITGDRFLWADGVDADPLGIRPQRS